MCMEKMVGYEWFENFGKCLPPTRLLAPGIAGKQPFAEGQTLGLALGTPETETP